jgi:hypothetical protein
VCVFAYSRLKRIIIVVMGNVCNIVSSVLIMNIMNVSRYFFYSRESRLYKILAVPGHALLWLIPDATEAEVVDVCC